MKIAGVQKISFVDFPQKIATVVFTQGCNMNCSFCHNMALIQKDSNVRNITQVETIEFLKRRIGLVDAVVISGGEPTLQPDLKSFIKEIKDMGFSVKLDTNGTNPAVVSELMADRLIDYVAMDIKAPQARYNEICQVPVDLLKINETIQLLKSSSIDYEFRTTYAPELKQEDLVGIARDLISGSKRYIVQQYREMGEDTGLHTGNVIYRTINIDTLAILLKNVSQISFKGDFIYEDEKTHELIKNVLTEYEELGKKIEAGQHTPQDIERFNQLQEQRLKESVESAKQEAPTPKTDNELSK